MSTEAAPGVAAVLPPAPAELSEAENIGSETAYARHLVIAEPAQAAPLPTEGVVLAQPAEEPARRPKKPRNKMGRTYPCTFEGCDKVLTTSSHRTEHLRTHTKERPYRCDICELHFAHTSALKVHKRIHTGERPFACNWQNCEKGFMKSYDLQRHMRTHTMERPYACTYGDCTVRFSQASHLQKHIKTHEKTAIQKGAAAALHALPPESLLAMDHNGRPLLTTTGVVPDGQPASLSTASHPVPLLPVVEAPVAFRDIGESPAPPPLAPQPLVQSQKEPTETSAQEGADGPTKRTRGSATSESEAVPIEGDAAAETVGRSLRSKKAKNDTGGSEPEKAALAGLLALTSGKVQNEGAAHNAGEVSKE